MKRKTRITLIEDHPEYRKVLEFALEEEADMELVSRFGAAEVALRNLQDMSTRREADIILLDLSLPGMSGLEAIGHLKASLPTAEIIILTQSDREADVLRAIQSGAAGYLLKSSSMQEIAQGIRTVISGGATLDANVARFIVRTLQAKTPNVTSEKVLSDRELEILTLLADGLPKKKIADRLCISSHTVVSHIRHIYEKLNVPNAPSAVSKAYRLGIFPVKRTFNPSK